MAVTAASTSYPGAYRYTKQQDIYALPLRLREGALHQADLGLISYGVVSRETRAVHGTYGLSKAEHTWSLTPTD